MSRILVTGANGQLGNEIRSCSEKYYGYEFIFTDIDTLDISDAGKTSSFIKELQPSWVLNCAAYNFVDKAESEQDKAMLLNYTAVKNLSAALEGTSSRFIHISSDYVFDGTACTPYTESAETGPSGIYGRSKLAGEKVAMMHSYAMVIRTSWLYSVHGTNFVKTILNKAGEMKNLRVVFDQTGSPTWAHDLADAIMTIISGVIRNKIAFYPGIYHYSNEGVCSWYDFAVEIVRAAGLECTVTPVRSSEYQTAAKRPSYSVLDKTRIRETYNISIPHWRTSLLECMKSLV
jgi:dTDP-4-dehydrorhamnose reductase